MPVPQQIKSHTMKKNMSSFDRIFRIVFAVIAVILFATEAIPFAAGLTLVIAGGVLLLTSVVSFCPIYAALGVKTCKTC